MQDPDVPPEAEGETDGGADAVRLIVVHTAADTDPVTIASNSKPAAASIPPPWTIAIGQP
jgi:hypothetical protein